MILAGSRPGDPRYTLLRVSLDDVAREWINLSLEQCARQVAWDAMELGLGRTTSAQHGLNAEHDFAEHGAYDLNSTYHYSVTKEN